MLDKAFDTLRSYDWGQDPGVLSPIHQAVVTTRDDLAARKALERRLVALLQSDVPHAAKDFVCRQLMICGTEDSVAALAALLNQRELSHMARYALERIPAPEAGQALRDALPKLSPELRIGVISSLGVRQDTASIEALAKLLDDGDAGVARAAAFALGSMKTQAAAQALASARSSGVAKSAVTDASLACAEGLLSSGKTPEALVIYKRLATGDQPKHVRLAATRGMLACAGSKS